MIWIIIILAIAVLWIWFDDGRHTNRPPFKQREPKRSFGEMIKEYPEWLKKKQYDEDARLERAARSTASICAMQTMNGGLFSVVIFEPYNRGIYTVYDSESQRYEKPGLPSYNDLCEKFYHEELDKLGYQEKKQRILELMEKGKYYEAWMQ